MTPQEHRAQRDMVVRSLLVSSSRSERSEERPRKRVNRPSPPPVVDGGLTHRYRLPVVTERFL